jgi:hypothetical protein
VVGLPARIACSLPCTLQTISSSLTVPAQSPPPPWPAHIISRCEAGGPHEEQARHKYAQHGTGGLNLHPECEGSGGSDPSLAAGLAIERPTWRVRDVSTLHTKYGRQPEVTVRDSPWVLASRLQRLTPSQASERHAGRAPCPAQHHTPASK